ncbi:MAG: metallophosphoesterase [Anaerolineae bacterium]|nr:metallophosphoesterase [Anaerolineae bacterium]
MPPSTRPLRTLAVSDQVIDHLYNRDVALRWPGIKLIFGCGDLPFYYLDFLSSALDAPLLYVRGNHDAGPYLTSDGRNQIGVECGRDIHAHVIEEQGLLIAGLEGSMRYRPKAKCMYSEEEMAWEIGRLLPALLWNRLRYGRFLDVLITHSPPYGIHDLPDRAHTGFKVFLTLMRWARPRYLLHGHIHTRLNNDPQLTRYHDTTVINVYPYRLIEI